MEIYFWLYQNSIQLWLQLVIQISADREDNLWAIFYAFNCGPVKM